MGWVGGMDWIDLAQDRDSLVNLRVPQNARNFGTS